MCLCKTRLSSGIRSYVSISSSGTNQAVQRSSQKLSLDLSDLCTPPPRWGIHSSMYLFGDREQLEHLTCRHPDALDSVLNWPCPAHHHRTTAYQDTEMTCNMSPDSERGGESSFILSLACHFFCLLAF